ncbi:formin protein 20 [Biomphalaria glabrata]|nr:formin protein 20 [Biomphalaria glabrata]
MYRALYAYKSELPKYLSFEAGDRFTLLDTSVSNQWFLAQNGLGNVGYVPFNYIKKIEATTEQQVKFIDGAMEAIHLQATNAGGQYTHEQRVIMKRLVKHRSEVIKNAPPEEKKSSTRRRPAPAPPVDKSATVELGDQEKGLSIIGQQITPKSPSDKKESVDSFALLSKEKKKTGMSKTKKSESRLSSAHSDICSKETSPKDTVKKSKSVTSSIGQAPSLVSSFSSNASDLTTTDSITDASKTSEGSDDINTLHYNMVTCGTMSASHDSGSDVMDIDDSRYLQEVEMDRDQEESNGEWHLNNKGQNLSSKSPQSQEMSHLNSRSTDGEADLGFGILSSNVDYRENYQGNDTNSPIEDLPPPPPEIFSSVLDDNFSGDEGLPPAPCDLTPTEEILKMDDMYVSLNSDILELCGRRPLEECCCDDFQPKFDPKGTFFAQNSLALPASKSIHIKNKDRHDSKLASRIFASVLKNPDAAVSQDSLRRQQELLELAQVHCVQVTHADCEEMIGEFRKLTNLSHEESHWAILAVMNMLAAKVPHIRPSLEVVGLRFNLAHECRSTGKDYQCDDTLAINRLISELAAVTNDSQQRGHYLRDDLDSIIDIISGLTDTLSNAKHCVSVAAIQKDNYDMVEVIAKYYQMETRWVIHSCLLQLVETICRLNSLAIQEFLYSELPQELVAEMQQHHNCDTRVLQIAKTLGIIFMKGQPSPHKLASTMDIHFFIWLLGMSEMMAEKNRLNDVDMLLALVCAYHLQHEGCTQNPVTDAFKMAQGHALLASSLIFLSKHDDPTRVLESGVESKVNSVILLLTNLYDNIDTSDLLYTNDVEALIGIFEEFLRDLSRDDPKRKEILHLLENFMRNYPDTVTLRGSLSQRLGPLLFNIREEKNKFGEMAARILEDNSVIFCDA